jgi:hypothetical protein
VGLKLIIAGSREYKMIENLVKEKDITEIVSGGATGVDTCAIKFGLNSSAINKITVIKADWAKYGKKAGPIRNAQMAEYADALYAFPGGNGTKSMINEAKKAGLIIWD